MFVKYFIEEIRFVQQIGEEIEKVKPSLLLSLD